MLTQDVTSTLFSSTQESQYTFKWISELLWDIGIPLNVHGYRYLLDAVRLSLSQPAMSNNLSHQLYPCIAKRYDTSPSCVERSIRHAIQLAWTRGRLTAANDLFGRSFNFAYEKPTNGEMIALLTEKVRIKQYESCFKECSTPTC